MVRHMTDRETRIYNLEAHEQATRHPKSYLMRHISSTIPNRRLMVLSKIFSLIQSCSLPPRHWRIDQMIYSAYFLSFKDIQSTVWPYFDDSFMAPKEQRTLSSQPSIMAIPRHQSEIVLLNSTRPSLCREMAVCCN